MHHPSVFALVTLASWSTAGAFFEVRGRAPAPSPASALFPRGGADPGVATEGADPAAADPDSLDERVNAAMRRLGLGVDGAEEATAEPRSGAADAGAAPPAEDADAASDPSAPPGTAGAVQEEPAEAEAEAAPTTQEDVFAIAERLAAELSVPRDLVVAALYASFADGRADEGAARNMVQAEAEAVAGVDAAGPEVATLVGEGHDEFYARRALAFAEMSVDNARAMLAADREDEEAERAEEEAAARAEEPLRTVTVDYPADFNPLAGAPPAAPPPPESPKPDAAPVPAKKEDVVFEGTAASLQELVLESPVPVLLDVYADWCGPCKQLTPALEQICINAGGALRLVKIDTDAQRQLSAALGVKSLPTVFGLRDGKVVHSFQGLPRDEATVRNFLMGLLVPGQGFQPPVSEEEQARYDDLTHTLLQLAAGASFSFADRERLENHMARRLDELAAAEGGEAGLASARVLRALAANVVAHPFDEKYRRIKLDNPAIKARVADRPQCVSILKSLGFVEEDGAPALVVGRGKRVVNVTPFVLARGCIDKWIEKNRHEIAKEGRRQRDEVERARLAVEAEEAARLRADEPDSDSEEEEAADDHACVLKLRLEGKKRVHELLLDADDTLATVRARLPFSAADDAAVRFTCAARRLVVDGADAAAMARTLAELRLAPAATVVVRIGDGGEGAAAAGGGLAARRAAAATRKSTGSHSMHSIGLYAQDDGNKAETYESGGVLYDHVLTDDEDEEEGGEEEEDADAGSDGAQEKEDP